MKELLVIENLLSKIQKRIKRFLGRKVGMLYRPDKILCSSCIEGFTAFYEEFKSRVFFLNFTKKFY